MRYTLEQLEEIVPKILRSGFVNRAFEGYPILHSVAIELRDEMDTAKHVRYFRLLKMILEDSKWDPNVVDKHKKQLLAYAAEEDSKELLKLLLKYKADPNLVDGRCFKTPLEWAIYGNASPKVIRVLSSLTVRTAKMAENSQELFERALDDVEEYPSGAMPWINTLLDLRLVSYKRKFTSDFKQVLNNGLWIRTVADPDAEREILKKRDSYTDSGLAELRHTMSRSPSYTPYSPATYVKPGVPISLFGGGAGVMIQPSSEKIAYWYDGRREELTRDMNYYEGSVLSNHGNSGEYHEITGLEIESVIGRNYLKEIGKCRANANEAMDKHGILLDRMLCDIFFPWNEGLIRYKFKDIVGICVTEDSAESWKKAFELQKKLALQVPLYRYDSKNGKTIQYTNEELVEKRNLASLVVSIRNPFLPRYQQYRVNPEINVEPGSETNRNTHVRTRAVAGRR